MNSQVSFKLDTTHPYLRSGFVALVVLSSAFILNHFWREYTAQQVQLTNLTATAQRLATMQSEFDAQVKIWNSSQSPNTRPGVIEAGLSRLPSAQEAIYSLGRTTIADLNPNSEAKVMVSRFLSLYGEATKLQQYQIAMRSRGDSISHRGQQSLRNMLQLANHHLQLAQRSIDTEVAALQSRTHPLSRAISRASPNSLYYLLSATLVLTLAGGYYRRATA